MTQSGARPARPRTQRSLQILLAILLGSVVGCVTIALALVFAVREDQDVRDAVALETASTAASTSALLQTQFEQQLLALAMIATGPELVADLEGGRTDLLNARLERLAPANPDFGRLAVIDAAGYVVANSVSDKSSLGRSFGDQPHVRDALRLGKANVGVPRPALGQTVGAPVLPMGVPIFGKGRPVVGVLQATTTLAHLNDDIKTIRVGRTGFVSIATADGMLVVHPESDRLLTSDADAPDLLLDPGNPLAQFAQLASPGRRLWFGSTVTMPSTGWAVRAQMPGAEPFESLWQRVRTAGVVVVSLSLLAILLGVIFARRITAPLAQLIDVVEQVGTKSAIESLPQTHVREVAQLAAAFGAMHERLTERTIQQQAAEATLRRQAANLEALMGLNRSLVSSLALEDVLREVTRSAATLLSAPLASFWVVDRTARTLELRAVSDEEIGRSRTVRTAAFGQGVAGWVAEYRTWQNVDDVFADGRTLETDWRRQHGLRSMLTVPVLDNGDVVAVLSVHGREPFRLGAVDENILSMFLAQAAIALRNASLYASQAASRAAAELAEAQFRALIEAAPDAVIIRNESGELLLANRRAQELYRSSESEMLGTSLKSAVSERTWAAYRETHDYLIAHPGEVRTLGGPDILAVRSDGSETPIEVSATCILTPDGPRRIGILRDVSDRDALDRMKEQFVSVVSHELRTPLTPVIGLAQLLASTQLNETQRHMVETIERSSQHLLAIVNDLLDYSKMQARELTLDAVRLDLRDVVKDTVDLLGARAIEKRLRLAWQVADDVPRLVHGDPVRLRQILSNLVANAIKFTHTGGVLVRARLAEDGPTSVLVRVDVADTGIGIDPAVAGLLFDPFVQASSSTTREYGGTGLGLPICKHLSGLMGGQIGVEGSVGRGSTFWFTVRFDKAPADQIPADHLRTASHSAATGEAISPSRSLHSGQVPGDHQRTPGVGLATLPPPSPPRGAPPILVVEDSPMNQLTVLSMLEHLGYQGRAVGNGLLAVEALEAGTYAAVLMDCQMPVMDGFEATVQIRQRQADRARLPVIAMTASVMLSDRERCLGAGMDDYIAKPLVPAALSAALDRWVGRAAGSDDLVTGESRATGQSPSPSGPAAQPQATDYHPSGATEQVGLLPAALLNIEHLAGLSRIRTPDGATLVDRMIGYFVEASPAHLQRIREATSARDLPALAQTAHKLTGESATVGALEVGRLAREIELTAGAGTIPDDPDLVNHLDRAVSAATTALLDYQARLSASPAA
jgi:PAS domain S-box-containing protein